MGHKNPTPILAREYGVTRLKVFVSACTLDWNPETSDIDSIDE